MKTGSLRLRLLAAASFSLLVALVLIGVLLVWVFERHVRGRMVADLGHQLNQLAALAVPATGNTLKVDGEMTDPRFDRPLGGIYWQIDREGKAVLRSRSLWDMTLEPQDPKSQMGVLKVSALQGPGGAKLLAASKIVQLARTQGGGDGQTYRLTVAADMSELDAGRNELIKTLVAGLSIAFAGLALAAWAQVKFGLMPLEAIRKEIASVRTGQTKDLDLENFPTEVVPLADEINRFLANQRTTVERARWRASDLAHGLKTPLASMAAVADALKRDGYSAQAANLKTGIETMQRHIERQLALARSHGGSSAVTSFTHGVGNTIETMIEVLRKLPSERSIKWSVTGDVDVSAEIEAEDFEEIIGNLLDNARKWAHSSVMVQIASAPEGQRFIVSDDGPGISDENISAALQRGTRLDERVQGSGLGLSIVQTVLETYGSELFLDRSEAGGLEARFTLFTARAEGVA